MKHLKIYTILCISSFLVACGGGGGGSGDGGSPARVDIRPVNPRVIEQPLPVEKPKAEEKPPMIIQPIIQPIIEPVIQPKPEKPLPENKPIEKEREVDPDPKVKEKPLPIDNPIIEAPPIPVEKPKVEKPLPEDKPIEKEREVDPNPKVEEKPLSINNPVIEAPPVPVEKPKVEKPLNKILPVPNLTEDKNDNITGKGVTVGILDSDFKTEEFQNYFEKEFKGRLTALEKESGNPNGSEHGKTVASILGGKSHGIAKDVNIVAASVGDIEGQNVRNIIISVTRKAYEQILEKNPNVKIFNQSFGRGELKDFLSVDHPYQYLSDDKNKDALYMFNFYKEQVKAGKLFIWAAGNYHPRVAEDGTMKNMTMKDPSLHAALPYIIQNQPNRNIHDGFTDADAKNLSDGWLSVVGIDPKTRKHYTSGKNPIIGHLAYAGRAKEWSISAFADDSSKLGTGIGSSFAAPKVSAAAALVSQKYPWMDGNNIKQTLLTTADIIDDMEKPAESGRTKKNLSEKYGWGLLNIQKALNGPSEFSEILNRENQGQSYFKATLGNTGSSSTFSNEITGLAGLMKSGKDKLILSRNNSYTGKTKIQEGALELWGNSLSEMDIYKGAELILKNNLTITQNVENSGTLSLDKTSSPTLAQNYTAYKDSTTKGDINSKLYVKGVVDIKENATFDLQLEDGKYFPKNDVARELIVSELAIQGDFKTDEKDNLVDKKIETAENKVLAHVSRKDTEEYARAHSNDATTLNVARNLELAFHNLDEKIENGDANIEALTKEAALLQTTSLSLSPTSANFDSLSGQIYASAQSLTFKQAEFVNKEIANRLATLGMLQASEKKYGAWMSTFYSKASLEREGYAKADTRLSGSQFGFDKKFKDSILGFSFVHSNAKADFNRYSGHANSESYGLSLYGRKNFYADRVYLQGKISAHTIKTKVERAILNTNSSINHKDLMLSSYLESGYNFRLNNHTLSPFVAIESNRLRRNSFSENSSSFALKADKKIYQQNILKLGIREQYQFYTNSKVSNTLSVYLLQNFNLSDRSLDFDAKFNATNTNVKVKGIGLGPNSTHFGLGLVTEFSPSIATYANFDVSMERKKVASTMYTLGLRWSF